MKKYTLLIVTFFLIITGIFAQTHLNAYPIKTDNANAFKETKFNHGSISKDINGIKTGYIDYSWQNANNLSYIWQFNSLYTSTDTAFNYIGVAFYPFMGINDYNDNVTDFNMTPYISNLTFTIDSIYAFITHENNSGTYNKLTMEIVQLSSTNTLTSSATVLWSQVDSTNFSLSPGGNWLGPDARYFLSYTPGFTTTPGQKIGVVFKYKAPDADTLGVIGSSIDDGNGGTTTQSPFPTSFVRYPPFINSIIPNRNIGYGNPTGSAGWLEAQDWEIWIKVTFNDMVGISDNEPFRNIELSQNIPNPAKYSTIINYNLLKEANIKFLLCDITGRLVFEKTENNVKAGRHSINLDLANFSKGIYFYSLSTGSSVVTKKLIIE